MVDDSEDMVKGTDMKGEPNGAGLIEAGESCCYSDECKGKDMACNGDGCPIADGKATDVDFSCGLARFFKTFGPTIKD